MSSQVQWRESKNVPIWKCHRFLRNDPIAIIFGEDPDRLQVFFAHIFSSIGLVFEKLQTKTYFFTFSKTLKNTYMTSKIHPPKLWHYEFFSYFGFGSKQSIAIFSAIQNVIWSRIDDFSTFLKIAWFSTFYMFFNVIFSSF